MNNTGYYVAKMWHEILMNSSSKEDVAKYSELMKRSPVEIRLIIMAGTSSDLLLRDYISILHIPKSTLTSILNRLEKEQFLKRKITPKDRRSYALELDAKGIEFLKTYMTYQNDIGARIISALTDTEKEQLIFLLNKITDNMVKEQKQ